MTQSLVAFSPGQGMISNKEFLEKIIALVNSKQLTLARKQSRGEVTYYYNIPCAFDIEVSSFYYNGEKRACMYIWQFGILNWVTYGRTWEEYITFLKAISAVMSLSKELKLICYIHNLSYEFQFMRQQFEWEKVFFLDKRKPVYAVSTLGVEFRCSWKLSSKSLKKVGEDLQKYTAHKSTGDLDYSLPRHSKTKLTDQELGYCENDIRVLLAYIQEKIEIDGSIANIPLTNTGYVRQHCRKICFKKRKIYQAAIHGLNLVLPEYLMLKDGYAGGFTHGNASYVHEGLYNKIQHNVVSKDFTSSYPAVMVLEKFPMSTGEEVTELTMSEFHRSLKYFCCLIEVTFYDVESKLKFEHPLSLSKCKKYNKRLIEVDNGRVVSAPQLTTTMTEQDWFTFREFYKVSNFDIHRLIRYRKSYLPRSFILSILELYRDKTKLKGKEGEEINYMIKKNMLNSAYGMTVTDIIRDEIFFLNYAKDPFPSEDPEYKDYDKETIDRLKLTKMEEAIEKYNNGNNRFLFYPWGVWVCAYARRNLFTAIKECGKDYVYSDTDSVKYINPEKHAKYFEEYNENILKKIDAVCEYYKFKPEEREGFSPETEDHIIKTIGFWDDDGVYDDFKTLGAKRYMTRTGNKYKLTVAGLNKSQAMEWILEEAKRKNCNPFNLFNNKLSIPPSHSGRLVHTYFDEPCDGILVDYNGVPGEYHEKTYIHMEPTGYDMSMSDDYSYFLDHILEDDEEMFM